MDRQLVIRAAGGDSDAFAALAREAAPRLYAIAYRILRDPDRADEALQAALIAIWNDIPTLREVDRFDAWSCRILVRCAYREARRERRWTSAVRMIAPSDCMPDIAMDIVLHDELERAFRRLPPEHRAVLVLRYFAGLSVPEIAETLGIPLGTAMSRIHYAMRELRAAIDADARRPAMAERAV